MNNIIKICALLLAVTFSQCTAQVQQKKGLVGTTWEYAFDEDIKDYIKFFGNNKYESYSGEGMMTSIGVYFIESDTLNLVSILEVDNDHRFKARHTKAIVNGDKLKYVSFERINNSKWQVSDYIPPEFYFFSRVK